jgi:hypothetical protein
MQRVIPAALLLKHRGLHYLHPECSPPSGTAKLLKIHLQDDCFEILCDIWQKMLEGEDGIHLVQSHNFGWLAEVMVLLSELVYASGTTEDHSSKFNTLRALPLVPLDGSSEKGLMPIKDGVIFQPQGEFDSALLNFLGISITLKGKLIHMFIPQMKNLGQGYGGSLSSLVSRNLKKQM